MVGWCFSKMCHETVFYCAIYALILKCGLKAPSSLWVCSRDGCQVVLHLSWGESFEAGLIADPDFNVLLCHLTLKALLKHQKQGIVNSSFNKRENSNIDDESRFFFFLTNL